MALYNGSSCRAWRLERRRVEKRISVGIRPRINHMKLNEHMWRLLFMLSVRIARSKFFSLFLLFLPTPSQLSVQAYMNTTTWINILRLGLGNLISLPS
jgi:hypothetical protein